MATSDKIERLRERLLVCPICRDEFKDPRLLPCHHTVCFECIGNIVRSSSNTGRLFRCPQCRTDVFVPRGGIDAFPISFYILSVQDELGSKGYSSSCDICEREWMQSQFKCVDCDLDICRFCIHEHRLCHHDSTRHAIIRIETAPNAVNMSSNRTCPKHADEILQIYCITCDVAVCITCSCEDHKLHDTVPMTKKLREAQKQLQTELDRLTLEKKDAITLMEGIQTSIEEIKTTSSKALMEVDKRSKHLQQNLERLTSIKKDLLQNEETKGLQELSSYSDELKSYFDQLDNGVHFLEELQEGDMCLELLDGFEKFQKTLCEQKQLLKSRSLTYKTISFENGQDYIFRDVMFLNFGSLVNKKKTLNSLGVEMKLSNNDNNDIDSETFTMKKLIGSIFMLVILTTLGQIFLAFVENPNNFDVIFISLLCLVYLFVASYFAYRKSSKPVTYKV
ncbi:hypothetical protein SNE40_023339 [Patella caerulea]|uniref:Uncharacterized protein n=1 Tax=Patella caerulea TaxID=87958 RepID=A0AAN8G683_PATCE